MTRTFPICLSLSSLPSLSLPQIPGHGKLLRAEAQVRREGGGPQLRLHAVVRVLQRLQEHLEARGQKHLQRAVGGCLHHLHNRQGRQLILGLRLSAGFSLIKFIIYPSTKNVVSSKEALRPEPLEQTQTNATFGHPWINSIVTFCSLREGTPAGNRLLQIIYNYLCSVNYN